MTLKIPTSPESDGEIYLTPNTSVVLDDDKTDDGDAPPLFKIMKIQSMGNITTNHRNYSNDDGEDQVDAPPSYERYSGTNNGGGADLSFGAIYRMKSLGNLSQYERSFGDTPKELLKLKEEFERRRFGLARRRSLTNLLADDNQEITEGISDKNAPKRDSIFTTRASGPINGKYKKKIGIGDTKYIGNDEPVDKHYHLTKMKSLGTIPDLVAERINYEPFLTPLAHRRHPASLHDYRPNGPADSNSSSSDGDDEAVACIVRRNHEHMRFINEISLLRGPFERGFRRSYSKDPNRIQSPTTPLRQSDGYFQMPHLPVIRRSQLQRPISGSSSDTIPTRSSLHNLPTNGKIDVIRYNDQ